MENKKTDTVIVQTWLEYQQQLTLYIRSTVASTRDILSDVFVYIS